MTKSVYTDAYRAFAAILKDSRRSAKLTQQKVAKRLGRPQSFVAKYETGERRIDLIEFIMIADALRISPATLLAKVLKVAKRRS